MSDYPGNPALAAAVKDRVSSTFQQTLALYRSGRMDEVLAGCNLILQMDPVYDPAKRLLEKVRNPASAVDVETLAPVDVSGSLREAREAMGVRDFQRVVQITTEILTDDLMNDEARVLSEAAREKMEAAPFVEQFVKKCEQHLGAGNVAAAQGDLEKARSLDADHPGVQRMQQMIARSGGKPAPPAATPAPPAVATPAPPAAATPYSFDSFVVDTPPSTGRTAAQASDFGFTFEEDKPAAPAAPAAPVQPPPGGFGSFSFDTPSSSPFSTSGPMPSPIPAGFSFEAPAKAPGSAEYDFSTASIETTPADQQKIEQYLVDGDQAFASGNYQQAIDLWSRIFLIDVTNEQASERIERAKTRRRETDQKGDAALAAGVQAFERRDHETARAHFSEALRLDPNSQSARDYLERLSPGAAAADPAVVPPPPATSFDIFSDEAIRSNDEAFGAPKTSWVAPIPSPRKAAAAAASKAAAAKPTRQTPVAAIAIVIGLLVIAAGGWFVWSKFMGKPASNPAVTEAILQQASSLAQAGKYDRAIAILQEVKPDDPQHDRAIVMIAELQRKKTQAAEMIEGRPVAAFYQEQLSAGRSAFEANDYDRAKKAFEQALRVRALPADAKQMYDRAAQQASKLDSARALFNERKYQDAIGNLQSLLLQDPQNKSIQRMIIDAHFNLGATALQEERLPDAVKEFDNVLKVDPNDDLAKRSRELAFRYNGQQKDLLYKIYVKYLPLRQVT